MKFAALALALLLAVGSQAASLQADAPSQLAHARAAMDMYLTQMKESAKKALDHLDDAEYAGLKTSVSQRLDDLHTQIKTLQQSVSPMTDSVVGTVADATADVRASIMSDIDNLKTELEVKRAHLKEVIEKHIAEYRTQLEPIVSEYSAKHVADMDALKAKLEPVMEELRAKIAVNVEETKAALMPIVEAVRTKLAERLENLKEMATPYVEEYKDQLTQAMEKAKTMNTDEFPALREKIAPLAEEIKAKLQAVFEVIVSTFNKN